MGSLTGTGSGTPGVLDVIGGEQAALTVAAYVVGLVVVVCTVMRRRDLA